MNKPAKSSRHSELLRELQELENENLKDLEEPTQTHAAVDIPPPTPTDTIDAAVQAPKKPRTAKQLEAFEKAKAIRDANFLKRKQEAERIAAEEKKKIEEKLVKKAIAVKKKQIKQQKILDEIPSDDDTPVQKSRDIQVKPSPVVPPPPRFSFF